MRILQGEPGRNLGNTEADESNKIYNPGKPQQLTRPGGRNSM